MIGRKAFLALLAVFAVALAPGAAALASAADGGASTVAAASKTKKKGKGKRKSCKGKKGKAKKKCLRNQKKNKGSGKLANGRYEDQRNGVTLKVTKGGKRIRLDALELPGLCLPQEVGTEKTVPLKSRKGKLVAKQSFTVAGTQTTVDVDWSAEIDPGSLRYSLEYEARFELVSPDQEPVHCEDSDRYGGKLSH